MELRSIIVGAGLTAIALSSMLSQPVQAFTMTIENDECIFHMNHSDDDRMQKWFQIRRELGKEIVKQLQKGSAGSRL